jgi:hypothetical protein
VERVFAITLFFSKKKKLIAMPSDLSMEKGYIIIFGHHLQKYMYNRSVFIQDDANTQKKNNETSHLNI